MGKNIVLCLDGTWNGPDVKDPGGSYTPTNVQKAFESLAGSGPLGPTEEEKEVSSAAGTGASPQVALYIHGVGDASNALARLVQGSVGLGLIGRIVRGYTYLSRQYQPGDRIHIIGFSRGAYTARALAGFVVAKGLLNWQAMQLVSGSEASYSAGLAAWQQYKTEIHSSDSSILHSLAANVTNLYDRFMLGLHPAPALQLVANVEICAVGVWDTVGALGIPDNVDENGTVERLDAFDFVDNRLNPKVHLGFQALAIDEERVDFTPSLWNDRDGVLQVLFPGAHSDVGGGYLQQESGLSDGALIWMVRQLAAAGVQFAKYPTCNPDALAMGHRPWSGKPCDTALRHFPPGFSLSQRAVVRAGGGSVAVQGLPAGPYRPQNMVNSYFMCDWSGPAPHVRIEP